MKDRPCGRSSSLHLAAALLRSAAEIGEMKSLTHKVNAVLKPMFDQIGGIGGLVNGKTVAIKWNLTGGGRSFRPDPPGDTFWVNGKLTASVCHLIKQAGAKRIRLLESNPIGLKLEDKMLDGGWDVKLLTNAVPDLEFENTNSLGDGKRYSNVRSPTLQAYKFLEGCRWFLCTVCKAYFFAGPKI